MHQRRMVAAAQEIEQVLGRLHVRRKRIAQIGIEIRQPAAIHDHVDGPRQPLAHFRLKPEPRLACVSAQHLDVLAQEIREPVAMPLGQPVEHRRFLDHALESLERARRTVPAHHQMNAPDLRQIRQQTREPHFADEPRAADQQNVLAAQRFAHRKRRALVFRVEADNRQAHFRRNSLGRPNRFVQHAGVFREAEIAHQLIARQGPVRAILLKPRHRAARANHGIEQASRGEAIAKIQTIAENAPHAEMLRERTHDVIESLAHEHHVAARCE